MAATIEIFLPDALVKALGSNPAELPRRTLEAVVAQSFRSGQISHAQVAEALRLNRWETDAFLKQAEAYRPWEPEEFASDLATLRKMAK